MRIPVLQVRLYVVTHDDSDVIPRNSRHRIDSNRRQRCFSHTSLQFHSLHFTCSLHSLVHSSIVFVSSHFFLLQSWFVLQFWVEFGTDPTWIHICLSVVFIVLHLTSLTRWDTIRSKTGSPVSLSSWVQLLSFSCNFLRFFSPLAFVIYFSSSHTCNPPSCISLHFYVCLSRFTSLLHAVMG